MKKRMTSVTTQTTDNRLMELEIKAALAEDLLEELNRTVYRQQQQIEQLQQALHTLRQQVQAAPLAEADGPNNETPPHY